MIPVGDENPTRRFPVVTISLIMINIVLFLYMWLMGPLRFESLLVHYGAIPKLIVSGDRLWTLITSMFLHASPEHLIGNMIFLAIFGDNVEDRMGRLKFLAFYILSGMVAHLLHILSVYSITPEANIYSWSYWRLPDPKLIPAVGASGAISGVLGAYLYYYPNARVRVISLLWWIPVVYLVPAYYFIGFWFLFQLLMGIITLTGIPSGVAFWAHIGGFLAGLILAPILKEKYYYVPVEVEYGWS